MAAVEVIYLIAAVLWIGVVVAALCIGVRVAMKFRARRRRMNRLLDAVRIPARLYAWQGAGFGVRCQVTQVLANFLTDPMDLPRKHVAGGSRQAAPRRRRR